VQLVTVGALLEGKQLDLPRTNATFKKAPRAEGEGPEQLPLK
jgi:hypothetical protein